MTHRTPNDSLGPSRSEAHRRDSVVELVREHIRENRVIPFGDERFGGIVGPFSYFFEGEDDLLHVGISRIDAGDLSPEQAQQVMRFLLPDLPAGVVWLKPGDKSQHFYFGHDDLLT